MPLADRLCCRCLPGSRGWLAGLRLYAPRCMALDRRRALSLPSSLPASFPPPTLLFLPSSARPAPSDVATAAAAAALHRLQSENWPGPAAARGTMDHGRSVSCNNAASRASLSWRSLPLLPVSGEWIGPQRQPRSARPVTCARMQRSKQRGSACVSDVDAHIRGAGVLCGMRS